MKATCLLLLCYYIYFITAFQQRDTRFLRIFSIKANNDDEGWGNSKSYGFLPSGPDGLNDEDDKKSMLAKSSMGDKAFSFFTIMENTPPSEMILKVAATIMHRVYSVYSVYSVYTFLNLPLTRFATTSSLGQPPKMSRRQPSPLFSIFLVAYPITLSTQPSLLQAPN
jgi:hypothetical protein